MTIKKLLALVLSLAMVLVCLPAFTASAEEGTKIVGDGGLVLDTDATGGYEGDYVVIYNPATSSSTSYSTGTMTGLIETDIETNVQPAREQGDKELAIIDVDAAIAERERAEMGEAYGKIEEEGGARASFVVGSTRNFTISSYNPGSGSSLNFKVLAVGEHCYIWTPSQNVANYYTLDSINPDYAQQAADEFDRMYSLMNSSFGNHSNGSNGDGKVSLLFYNIDDGFDPETSAGYVAGYFSSASYSYDGLPIINIDTYPGIYYVTPSGVDRTSIDRAYGTACHEYQHCINYSNTSGMSTWLNECFSAAAEEICYPGSSIISRVQSWESYYYSSNDDWLDPPAEFQYDSSLTLHTGFSMYNWSNYLEMYDTLALYAQVSFFAQYLYTQFGNGIYKQISNKYSSSETTAITNATGVNCAELVKNFRIAMYANDPVAYDGQYGFIPQASYDPASYHNVTDPYNLLGPVVFTGTSCSIKGGGAICVKPVNGVYNPPSGASSNLVYIGITRNIHVEPVELTGISVTPESAELLLDQQVSLVLNREPANANTYEVVWTSSNDAVATVVGSNKGATVTSHAKGTAVITATATDTETGAVFTDTAVITVRNGYTYDYFEPTNTIETGVEYLIGYNNGGSVYLLMNYNPSPISDNYYYSYNNNYVGYGIKAILDGSGNVTGVDTSTYSAAEMIHTEWIFQQSGNYYTIGSAYQNGYYLRVYHTSNYTDLYASSDTSYATNWQWDSNNNRLSYYVSSSLTKYVQYLPNAGSYANFFQASTGTASVQLYKHITGTVMLDDTFTVTFVDWDGTVLSTQEVEYGQAAVAPAAPAREGYTFTGWDVDFSNVTSNLIVTAQYSVNSYRLTIYYRYADGMSAAQTYMQNYNYGAAYSVESPEIEGYTADITLVEGVMGAGNVTVTVTYTANAPEILLGDVNCDGHVDFADVTALYMFLIGSDELTAQGMLNADMNQDGNVDFSDVGLLYTMLLG